MRPRPPSRFEAPNMVLRMGQQHTFHVWRSDPALVELSVAQTRSPRLGRCCKNPPLCDLP